MALDRIGKSELIEAKRRRPRERQASAVVLSRPIRLAVLAVLGSGSVALAGDLSDAILRCASQIDDARRLACYDAEAEKLRSADPAPPATASRTGAAAATAPATTAAATTARTPASAGTGTATTPELTPEQKFGRRADPVHEEGAGAKEIEAAVARVSRRPDGGFVVTLDNGQVWSEISPNAKLRVQAGDRVRVERGALNSYLLISPNKRSSKVTRLQ